MSNNTINKMPFTPLFREHAKEVSFVVVGDINWALYPNTAMGEPDSMDITPKSVQDLFSWHIGFISEFIVGALDAKNISDATSIIEGASGFPCYKLEATINPTTGTYLSDSSQDPDLYPIAEASLNKVRILVYAYGLVVIMDKKDPSQYTIIRLN